MRKILVLALVVIIVGMFTGCGAEAIIELETETDAPIIYIGEFAQLTKVEVYDSYLKAVATPSLKVKFSPANEDIMIYLEKEMMVEALVSYKDEWTTISCVDYGNSTYAVSLYYYTSYAGYKYCTYRVQYNEKYWYFTVLPA